MRDRSPIWIGIADLLLCMVCVVICAVSPKQPAGAEMKAEYIASISWSNDQDADVDAWLNTPKNAPVYFKNRQVGCATLDEDNHGWVDSYHIVNGHAEPNEMAEEIIAIRCKEAGHYELATNLYAYSTHANASRTPDGAHNIHVHAKIEAVNPRITVLWQGEAVLNTETETINLVSFDIGASGSVTFGPPSLTPVTSLRQQGPQ